MHAPSASVSFDHVPSPCTRAPPAHRLDTEEHLQAAIESCPVNCIHWVDKEQLPMLEYVMQKRLTQVRQRVLVWLM